MGDADAYSRGKHVQVKTRPDAMVHSVYRADIDGLRAIAVLSVIAYHAFPGFFKAGFVGVDIFFVISGYLISSIIFREMQCDKFRFSDFYARRIRRIFPALCLVLLAIWIYGWFHLYDDEYAQIGKHIAAGTVFTSNFLLWGESGYFTLNSEYKPLLHLWSLGIEEQYYLVWPLLVWIFWSYKSYLPILILIVILTGSSFILNTTQVHVDPVGAFYSPITRFWQLLIGSALALYFLDRQAADSGSFSGRSLLATCGAIMLIVALTLIDHEKEFPGWWALLPTFGAAFLIAGGKDALLNKYILSHPILVSVGLISYPLYLWHWPLLSFLRIETVGAPSTLLKITVVALAFLLAWLTYIYIEKPIRGNNRPRWATPALPAVISAIGVIGFLTYHEEGFQRQRFSAVDRQEFANYFENSRPDMSYFKANKIPEKFRADCSFYEGDDLTQRLQTKRSRVSISETCYRRSPEYDHAVFIWGDSHAQHLSPGLQANLPPNWQILQVASSGCPPSVSAEEASETDYCQQSNWFALRAISDANPEVVVLSHVNGHSVETYRMLATPLLKMGVRKVLYVGPTPRWHAALPGLFLRKLWVDKTQRTFKGLDTKMLERNVALAKDFSEADLDTFINVMALFCNDELGGRG